MKSWNTSFLSKAPEFIEKFPINCKKERSADKHRHTHLRRRNSSRNRRSFCAELTMCHSIFCVNWVSQDMMRWLWALPSSKRRKSVDFYKRKKPKETRYPHMRNFVVRKNYSVFLVVVHLNHCQCWTGWKFDRLSIFLAPT